MLEGNSLYQLFEAEEKIAPGMQMVAALTGFADSGSAVAQIKQQLLDNLDSTLLVKFNNDEFLDYRARRPILTFEEDHLTDYQPAELAIYLMRDELDHPFLFLSGYEPDFKWEAFSDIVVELVKKFQVQSTTWVNSIPMPVPHTRPVGVTISGNRTELIDTLSIWKPTTEVPANILHLIEYKLFQEDLPVTGMVMLTPHYLADTNYPAVAIAAIETVSTATSLILPTGDLRDSNSKFLVKLSEQLETNEELGNLVSVLEQRHDNYLKTSSLPSGTSQWNEEDASADGLVEELERFLANRRLGEEESE